MGQGSGNDDTTLDELEYDEQNGAYRIAVDWTEEASVSTTIVMAVSAISDLDESAIEPLIERVDPDALDDLFAPHRVDAQREDGVVRFLFADHVVTVYARGEIVIDPPQTDTM
ncbi:HalOD1 output domain-containing protein [Halobacteriales archaeon Cl-PHB]